MISMQSKILKQVRAAEREVLLFGNRNSSIDLQPQSLPPRVKNLRLTLENFEKINPLARKHCSNLMTMF